MKMINKNFPGLEFIGAHNEPIISLGGMQDEKGEDRGDYWKNHLYGNVVIVSVVHRDNKQYDGWYTHEKDVIKHCVSKKHLKEAIKTIEKKDLNKKEIIKLLKEIEK